MNSTRPVYTILATAALAAAGLAAFPASASADTVSIGCSPTALVNAVVAAGAHAGPDTINLAAGCTYRLGEYKRTGNALPVLNDSVELVGAATVTRTGNAKFRIAQVGPAGGLTATGGVVFSGGNTNGDGGAILNYGAVTFTQSHLRSNTAGGRGGGLANFGAATFTGGTITGNRSGGRGGGINNRATLTTTGLSITDNRAGRRGGGIAAVESVATTLTNTTVRNNRSDVNAGGVFRLGGVVTVTGPLITGNNPNNCLTSVPAVPTCVR